MSYTNRTQNYGLPLWTSTDKPTFEGDLNGAMQTIDTVLKDASAGGEGVQEAIELANQANTNANQAVVTANAAQAAADSGVKLVVTTVDPGEGTPLAANTIVAVVSA